MLARISSITDTIEMLTQQTTAMHATFLQVALSKPIQVEGLRSKLQFPLCLTQAHTLDVIILRHHDYTIFQWKLLQP